MTEMPHYTEASRWDKSRRCGSTITKNEKVMLALCQHSLVTSIRPSWRVGGSESINQTAVSVTNLAGSGWKMECRNYRRLALLLRVVVLGPEFLWTEALIGQVDTWLRRSTGKDAGAAGASYNRSFGHLTEAVWRWRVAKVFRSLESSVHQFPTHRDA